MSIRLDKYLSDLGIGSRKETKDIIRKGLVTINGKVENNSGAAVDIDADTVALSGQILKYSKYRYFKMYKPCGVLTACNDRNAKTVIDMLPPELQKIGLFPVGRLDKDTRGLLLLTNNGDYAHKVITPKYHIEKRYHAKTDGVLSEETVEAFRNGIVLKDGTACLPAELELISENECIVTVVEGKYHQVRRMLASQGAFCLELERISVGPITLDGLSEGEVLEMTEEEAERVFV